MMSRPPQLTVEVLPPAMHTAEAPPRVKSILISNFFGGILRRGIPSYVEDLRIAFEERNVVCREIRCPKALRSLPRQALNLLFVLNEQFLIPVLGLRYDKVIYASNSASMFAVFSRRSALVIHDFISLNRRNRSFSARYVRTTQKWYSRFGRDVIFISRTGERTAQKAHLFARARRFRFPNAFFRFQALRSTTPPAREEHILLCSGWSPTKDLVGALDLYWRSGLHQLRSLRILGIAGHQGAVDEFLVKYPELREKISVLPLLSDRDVVQEYETACWVWVHSRKEGYGRSIAEARICNSRVVARNLAPFREQQDELVFFYDDLSGFERAIRECESEPVNGDPRDPREHAILRQEIDRFIR